MTGGAQGLGLVTARALLEHGLAALAIFDIDEEQGNEALQHFRSLDPAYEDSVHFYRVDVADEPSVDHTVDLVSQEFGAIDILVNFAGITGSKLAIEYPIDAWKKIFDVNTHGAFLIARAFAR